MFQNYKKILPHINTIIQLVIPSWASNDVFFWYIKQKKKLFFFNLTFVLLQVSGCPEITLHYSRKTKQHFFCVYWNYFKRSFLYFSLEDRKVCTSNSGGLPVESVRYCRAICLHHRELLTRSRWAVGAFVLAGQKRSTG